MSGGPAADPLAQRMAEFAAERARLRKIANDEKAQPSVRLGAIKEIVGVHARELHVLAAAGAIPKKMAGRP